MREQEVVINNDVGLHSQAAIEVVQTAQQFKSKIWIKKEKLMVSAKSLLGLLSLSVEKGDRITFVAEGCDVEEALDTMATLISSINEC